jgi:protein TonB
MRQRIQQQIFYPSLAGRIEKQGIAVAGITVRRDGKLVEARILRSAGNEMLDDAVLDAIRRAAPFRPLPPDFQGDRVNFTLSVEFLVRRR